MRLVSNRTRLQQRPWGVVFLVTLLQGLGVHGGTPCPAKCSGHGLCMDSGNCFCSSQWAGSDCSFLLEDSSENVAVPAKPSPATSGCQEDASCFNGGRCVAGQCLCSAGFWGPSCKDQMCPNNCWGHGVCDRGQCLCTAGWGGVQCESLAGAQVPAQHTKLQALSTEARQWQQQPAQGVFLAMQQQPLQQAVVPPHTGPSARALERARAAAEAARTAAEQLLMLARRQNENDASVRVARAIQRARSRVAAEGETTLGLLEAGARVVKLGKLGESVCGKNCSGNGLCNATGIPGCQCFAGWRGEHCESKRCPQDCSKGGVCVAGRCLCNAGFFGSGCQNRRCPQDCSGHGYCFAGRCECSGDYGGLACSELVQTLEAITAASKVDHKVVRSDPKEAKTTRGSLMLSLKAKESPKLQPTHLCPRGCFGKGTCLGNGTCSCHRGWGGEDCSLSRPVRCPDPKCSGHGMCDTTGLCSCGKGYVGPTCSIQVVTLPNACMNNCSGHGSCTHGICMCSSEWGGDFCELSKGAPMKEQHRAPLKEQPSQLAVSWKAQEVEKKSEQAEVSSGPITAAWLRRPTPTSAAATLKNLSKAMLSKPPGAKPPSVASQATSLLSVAAAPAAAARVSKHEQGQTMVSPKPAEKAAGKAEKASLANLLHTASQVGAQTRAAGLQPLPSLEEPPEGPSLLSRLFSWR